MHVNNLTRRRWRFYLFWKHSDFEVFIIQIERNIFLLGKTLFSDLKFTISIIEFRSIHRSNLGLHLTIKQILRIQLHYLRFPITNNKRLINRLFLSSSAVSVPEHMHTGSKQIPPPPTREIKPNLHSKTQVTSYSVRPRVRAYASWQLTF